MKEFHEIMREKRIEKGYSQYTLAKMVGVNQPTINHIEKGRRKPSFDVLVSICKALEIPLFGESTDDE